MNISLAEVNPPEAAHDRIEEHQAVMGGAGYKLTGTTCLLSEPDPNYPGSYQVWSETEEGLWVYVTPDGVAVEAACPVEPS